MHQQSLNLFHGFPRTILIYISWSQTYWKVHLKSKSALLIHLHGIHVTQVFNHHLSYFCWAPNYSQWKKDLAQSTWHPLTNITALNFVSIFSQSVSLFSVAGYGRPWVVYHWRAWQTQPSQERVQFHSGPCRSVPVRHILQEEVR